MATISTRLQLYDSISAPVMAMTSAMNMLVNRFNEVSQASDVDNSSLLEMKNYVDLANAAADQVNQTMQLISDSLNEDSAAADELRQAVRPIGDAVNENITEQRQFNSEIKNGENNAGSLQNKIMGVVGAYLSLRGVKKVLDLSDELTNTTARLNMINDGMQTTAELQDKIYQSAQRSRASYQMTADVVSKLALQARDAFSSNDEAIAFAEQLNKSFVISGTSAQGVESVMYNLTQALSSGVLRGQDLNAVFSNTPQIIQNVADYMGVTVGQIRSMAAEGQLSADVIKNAMLASADETDARFAQMPMTWSQLWTSAANSLYMAFQPVLEWIGQAATWIHDNWDRVSPVFYAVAAALGIFTAALVLHKIATWLSVEANNAFITSLLTNPLFYIAIALVVIITLIYNWIKAVGGIKIAWMIVVNYLLTSWDILKLGFMAGIYGVLNLWDKLRLGIAIAGTAVANFMGNMRASVLMILQNMVNGAIDIINGFISVLNNLPGVQIQAIQQVTFGTQAQLQNEAEQQARNAALDDFRAQVDANASERAAALNDMASQVRVAAVLRSAEILKAQTAAQATQDNAPTEQGIPPYAGELPPGVDDGPLGGIGNDTSNIANNTKNTAEISEENLKYLRDIAERDAINRFTTAEITIDLSGMTNTVNSGMDLDGMIDYIVDGTQAAIGQVAMGVHA